MAKVTRVHIRERRGTLFYDFIYEGIRCRESTGLRDTSDNRRRCAFEAQRIESDIALGQFDYVARFPEGNQRHHFTARPTGNITFERFALDVWLPHILTKIADSTAKECHGILTARAFPKLGSLLLKDLRPEHLDQFTNWLKSLQGHDGTLSPRRMNIILLRVRQVLDLAFEREYIDKNPHKWVVLQKERLPRVEPLSFEERQLLLTHLPILRYGIRKMCADFWKHYFIVAFDTGMRPSEQMALRWEPDPDAPERSSYVDFAHKKIVLGQGWVMGHETTLKTSGSYREIDLLPTVEEAIRALEPYRFCEWIFPSAQGERLWISNTRWRVWYPSLHQAGLRRRDLYQTRHTFASLMLQSGEDPAWVARMLGHATLQMLYERYGKFIQNRNRRDGELYLKRLKD